MPRPRLTKKVLQHQIDTANRKLGFGENGPAYNERGGLVLGQAYGGYAVHQYVGEHGGIRSLTYGHLPMRETSMFLQGYIAGLIDGDTDPRIEA